MPNSISFRSEIVCPTNGKPLIIRRAGQGPPYVFGIRIPDPGSLYSTSPGGGRALIGFRLRLRLRRTGLGLERVLDLRIQPQPTGRRDSRIAMPLEP